MFIEWRCEWKQDHSTQRKNILEGRGISFGNTHAFQPPQLRSVLQLSYKTQTRQLVKKEDLLAVAAAWRNIRS